MPKPKRKSQQHLRQEPARKRTYVAGGATGGEKYKTPFPMNLLSNVKVFYVIGAAVMIGGFFLAVILKSQNPSRASSGDNPTPSASVSATASVDPNASPTPTKTPNPKKFAKADQVIDAKAYDYQATIKTAKGDIVIQLFDDKSPNTVNSFVFLAKKGFYDGVTFHRVETGFVAQGGDPDGTGAGDYPGYATEQEPNDLKNKAGFVAMARKAGQTTFGSQFFINLKDNPALDQELAAQNQKPFYPFGQVTQGMDVVAQLQKGDVMQSVTIQELPQK